MAKRRRETNHALVQIRKVLRRVQNKSGCATATLDLVLQNLHPFLKGCEDLKQVHMKMPNIVKRQSVLKRQLHGCGGCNDYVFGPDCQETHCPKCDHPRYNGKGIANEVRGITWFPFISSFFDCFVFCYPLRCRFVGISLYGNKSNVWFKFLHTGTCVCTKKCIERKHDVPTRISCVTFMTPQGGKKSLVQSVTDWTAS